MSRTRAWMIGALLLLLLFYAADWVVWRIRAAAGSGVDTVSVNQVSVAALKGNKEEYFSDGATSIACSKSIFPIPAGDGWLTACWWLRRHPDVVQRY